MNVRQAITETMYAARQNHGGRFPQEGPLGLDHLENMFRKVTSVEGQDFSEGKLNRWLGWMQAACCAAGALTLEQAKDLNRRAS